MKHLKLMKPDFYQIFLEVIEEYEKKVGHSIDDADYPDYILYAMEKVYDDTKNNKI